MRRMTAYCAHLQKKISCFKGMQILGIGDSSHPTIVKVRKAKQRKAALQKRFHKLRRQSRAFNYRTSSTSDPTSDEAFEEAAAALRSDLSLAETDSEYPSSSVYSIFLRLLDSEGFLYCFFPFFFTSLSMHPRFNGAPHLLLRLLSFSNG